jgi:Tol biopolymer transport system component
LRFVRVSLLAAFAASLVLIAGAGAAPGTTERLSVNGSGTEGNRATDLPAVSPDARYVVFASEATNFAPVDGNGAKDVFLRDRQLNTIERVSLNNLTGGDADRASDAPDVSDDGRYVVFESLATDLIGTDTNADFVCDVGCDTNNTWDIFVRDRQAGTTVRASVSTAGVEANGASHGPTISADGRYVAFYSIADNLVGSDGNGNSDVFVRDLQSNTTTRVSVSTAGVEGNFASDYAAISGNGQFIAFASFASNLVTIDNNGYFRDIFVRDRVNNITQKVSVSTAGVLGDGESTSPSISADGRYVAFESAASTMVTGDTNTCTGYATSGTCPDVFVRDRQLNTTTRLSVDSIGTQANDASANPSISDDGRWIAFSSLASNLVSGDLNTVADAFARDQVAARTARLSTDSTGAEGDAASMNPAAPNGGRLTVFASDATTLVTGDGNNFRDVFLHTLADTDADGNWDPYDNCPTWPNASQTLPPWTVPVGDSDCDGYTDTDESVTLGTVWAVQCPTTSAPNDEPTDAWPPDFDDTRSINVSDVLTLKPVFGQTVPPAAGRYDLAVSGSINVTDVLKLKPVFGKTCS